MATAYITREELTGRMPLEDITAALSDGGSSDPDDVWEMLADSVADEINGLLAPRYAYPFAEPVQPTVKTAARTLSLYALFSRRGLNGDSNPMKDEAATIRAHLKNIGAGKILLDAGSPPPATPPAGRGPLAVKGPGIVASQLPGRMPV